MSVMDASEEAEPGLLSDSDLALVDAMQQNVRAPWARIGAQLGVSAPTARRRWERLVDSGAAWLTSSPFASPNDPWAFVDIRCRPGMADAVAERLVAVPSVLTVSAVTGERDLVAMVSTSTMQDLRHVLRASVSALDGVASVRTSLTTRIYAEGSTWRAREGRNAPPGASGAYDLAPTHRHRDAVLAVLQHDARAPASVIARALGTTDAHARRVTHELLASRQILQRVDVLPGQRIWPHSLVLWLAVAPAELDAVARRVAALPLVRLCAAVAGGSSNLYIIVWLRELADAPVMEARISGADSVRIVDRALILHYFKRLGHTFDENDRRSGLVPWRAEIDRTD